MKYNPHIVFRLNQQLRPTYSPMPDRAGCASNKLSRLCKGVSLAILWVIWMPGCASNPSPDANAPRTGDSTYPILLDDEDGDRREAALGAWTRFTRDQGVNNAPAADLQVVTSTLRSIPVFPQSYLHLPIVGDSAPMSEEETREALRRFIAHAGALLCSEPQQLSLVERVDGADGIKEAVYQQRPFRYPLRNGYGKLRIGFTSDGRIARISSTCIPETDRVRRSFVGLAQQRISADKAIESIKGRALDVIGADGVQQPLTIGDTDKVIAKELVVYPIERPGKSPVLEFHVAWEIVVDGTPGVTIYLDSIMGDILGVVRGQPL